MLEVLEVSPWHLRGRLAASISLGRAVGLLCASLLTFGLGLSDRAWGWRLVPLFAIGPALLTLGLLRCVHTGSTAACCAALVGGCAVLHLLGSCPAFTAAAPPLLPARPATACSWLPETSASLVLRGQLAEGRLALARVRGLLASSSTADAEFCDILAAAELSSRVGGPLAASWQRALVACVHACRAVVLLCDSRLCQAPPCCPPAWHRTCCRSPAPSWPCWPASRPAGSLCCSASAWPPWWRGVGACQYRQ